MGRIETGSLAFLLKRMGYHSTSANGLGNLWRRIGSIQALDPQQTLQQLWFPEQELVETLGTEVF